MDMIAKKLIFGLFVICLLAGCTSPTAMLGPVYTLSSTGNIFQAGINYGSNQMITMYTGKTPIENLQTINSNKKQEENIQKKTLESEDFYFLVKEKIAKNKKLFKLTNQ